MGDDPPYLTVGTEVSAKYKGAFCEAKIRKVVRLVKCKVTFKSGFGTKLLSDDQIKGNLRVGGTVEAKHPDKNIFIEATISRIQDCSQYTVVFDDGDITTLRRTALCLKSGRHFNESETLDQLPLTHPEHFSNPVVGGRRGVRKKRETPHCSNENVDDSSDDEAPTYKGRNRNHKGGEDDLGKVVCVEVTDKKKTRDNWFPALVVTPTAQETVKTRTKDEYLVRSFRDGRYYTVPKKETTLFSKDYSNKSDSSSNVLKSALEKAILYIEKNELPPHWDRDVLFARQTDENNESNDEDAASDSDVSEEDSKSEERDRFIAQLYKFMDDRGTPISKVPVVCNKDLDLYKLYKIVCKKGGYNKVTSSSLWKMSTIKMGFGSMPSTSTINLVKQAYKRLLHNFEEFYRKLGCSLNQNVPSTKSRSNRNLTRERHASTSSKDASKKDEAKDKEAKEEEEKEKDKTPALSISSGDNETDSVISDSDTKRSEQSDEPRRSRSRQDSRGTKKEFDEVPIEKPELSIITIAKKPKILKGKELREASVSPATTNRKGRGGNKYRRKDKEKDSEPSIEVKSEEVEGGRDHISQDVKVELGDKLRVYYGPKSDGKVTYEAKVVDLDDKKLQYLVHYTGWNTRYDEWIPRFRICENLSLRLDQVVSPAQGRGPAPCNESGTAGSDTGSPKTGITLKRSRTKKARALGTELLTLPGLESRELAAAGSSRKILCGESDLKKRKSRRMSAYARSESDVSSDSDGKRVAEKHGTPPSPLPVNIAETKFQHEEQSPELQPVPEPEFIVRTEQDNEQAPSNESKEKRDQVIDLNQIRAEMKGLDNMVKVLSRQSTPPPPDVKDKLDVYEFQDDANDATPSLKMFSPRSPEKKEDIIQKANEPVSLVVVSATALTSVDQISGTTESAPLLTFHAVNTTSDLEVTLPDKFIKTSQNPSPQSRKRSTSVELDSSLISSTTPQKIILTCPILLPAGGDQQQLSPQSILHNSQPSVHMEIPKPKEQYVSGLIFDQNMVPENKKIDKILLGSCQKEPDLIAEREKIGMAVTAKLSARTPVLEQPKIQPIGLELRGPVECSETFSIEAPQKPLEIIAHQQRPIGKHKHPIPYAPVNVEQHKTSMQKTFTKKEKPKAAVQQVQGKMKLPAEQYNEDLKSKISESLDHVKALIIDKFDKPSTKIVKVRKPKLGSNQTIAVKSRITVNVIKPTELKLIPTGLKLIAPSSQSKSKQRNTVLPPLAASIGTNAITIGVRPPPPPLIPSSSISIPRESAPLPPVQALSQCFMPILTQRPMGQIVVASSSPLVIPTAPPLVLQPSFTPIVLPAPSNEKPIVSVGAGPTRITEAIPRFGHISTASSSEKPLYTFSLAQCIAPGGIIRPPQLADPATHQQHSGVQIAVKSSQAHTISQVATGPPRKKQKRAISKKFVESESESSDEKGVLKKSWKKLREEPKPTIPHQIRPKLIGSTDHFMSATPPPSIIISTPVSSVTTKFSSSKLIIEPVPSYTSPALHSVAVLKRKMNESHKILPKPKSIANFSDNQPYPSKNVKPKKVNIKKPSPFNINAKLKLTKDIGIKVEGTDHLSVHSTSSLGPLAVHVPPVRFSVNQVPNTLTIFQNESAALPVTMPLSIFETMKSSTISLKDFGRVEQKYEQLEVKPIEEKPILEKIAPTLPTFNLQIQEKTSLLLPHPIETAVIIKEPSELGVPKIESISLKQEEESCHSLFCEEEIPGSPPPGTDSSRFGLEDDCTRSVYSPCPRSTTASPNKEGIVVKILPTSLPQQDKNQQCDSVLTDLTCTEEMKSEKEYLTSDLQFTIVATTKSDESPKFLSEAIQPVPIEEATQIQSAAKATVDNSFEKLVSADLVNCEESNALDNTPPTTPESCTSSDSPSCSVGGRTSPLIIEENNGSNKSKEPSDTDSLEGPSTKLESVEDGSGSSDTGAKLQNRPASIRKSKSSDSKKQGSISPPFKRRRISRRKSPDDTVRLYTSRGGRACSSRRTVGNTGSDCDSGRMPPPIPPFNLVRPPKSAKFNFIPDLDDDLDAEERISVITGKIQELREKYMSIKSDLAAVEKRRKRLKRREREKAATVADRVRPAELT